MIDLETTATNVLAMIEAYHTASTKYAECVADEMGLEDRRPLEKQRAVLKIMLETNPATNKPHSASSAEAVVETDPDYMQYRVFQRETVVEKNTAYAAMTAARLRAELGIALIHATGTVTA